MSIEEIIKALRRGLFSDTLLQLAADTIEKLESENNRQKAEIEDLKSTVTNDFDKFASEYDSKMKSEAVKEFDERLSREISKIPQHHFSLFAVQAVIEKVKKEMVGETK